QHANGLKWIHSTGAGVDEILYPEVYERELVITASNGIHAPLIEHVFAFILAFERRLHIAMRQQLQRRWDRSHALGGEVAGKTLGILGLGTIGREIARKAQGFDLRVRREGWMAGAGVDVFEREPLPADSPLYDLENVIITPHVSGASPRYMDRAVPLFCENLRRYLHGDPLLNVVDKERGY